MGHFYTDVYAVVRQIPPGHVTTYGTVARMLGRPRDARAVGYALRALPDDTDVPWQRVINAKGTISLSGRHPEETNLQRVLLEQEGVVFDAADQVDFARFGWGLNPSP